MSILQPRTVEDIQECVRAHAREQPAVTLRPVSGRTKSALSSPASSRVALDVSALTGVLDYEPAECTFTALPGTRVAEIETMLAEHGQYLPFEPPFAARGATLGGTVAAALSGPGRYRYGGVRDFLLGVRFIDGDARLIRGGGRVVKNAAGFYLQHLMLGSLGSLGVLTELTFKVFPLPQARTTLVADHSALPQTLDTLARLRRSAFELESVELVPPARLLLRLGGSDRALAARAASLSQWLGASGARVRELVDAHDERACWHDARELTWAPDGPLVKVAMTLGRIADVEHRLAGDDPPRRYGAGGEVAWIAWPHALSRLDVILTELQLPGLVLMGDDLDDPFLGPRPDPAFLARVRRTLDPHGVFGPLPV
jgi:glycolate oxidase FAD binding subunit